MRYMALAPRDNALKFTGGIDNLFCAVEKAGLLVGHTEAIVTGTLAGHSAAHYAFGKDPLILPDTIAIGDAISHVNKAMNTKGGMAKKFAIYYDGIMVIPVIKYGDIIVTMARLNTIDVKINFDTKAQISFEVRCLYDIEETVFFCLKSFFLNILTNTLLFFKPI